MTRLSDPERAQVDEAVTVIRKHRAASSPGTPRHPCRRGDRPGLSWASSGTRSWPATGDGRRVESATLVADARHSWLDALSSAGALAGLIAVASAALGDPVAGWP